MHRAHVLIVRRAKIVLYSLWYHHTYRCNDTKRKTFPAVGTVRLSHYTPVSEKLPLRNGVQFRANGVGGRGKGVGDHLLHSSATTEIMKIHPEDYLLHDRYMCVTLVLKKLELAWCNEKWSYVCSGINCITHTQGGRNSDSLRAGRSGDQIPVGTTFSLPVETGPEAHPASCTVQWVPGVSWW